MIRSLASESRRCLLQRRDFLFNIYSEDIIRRIFEWVAARRRILTLVFLRFLRNM